MALDNYYKVLGVSNFCTDQDTIKSAYRAQIKFFHPDLGNVSQEIAEAKTKELNNAYDILSDPQKKQAYDSQLRYEMGGNQQFNSSYSANSRSTSGYSSGTNAYSNSSNSASGNSSNSYTYKNSNSSSGYRNYNYSTKRKSSSLVPTIVLLLFIFGMCSVFDENSGSSNTNSSFMTQNEDANLTPVSISNGKILKYPEDEMIAPLTIETSGSRGYYIYLEDISNSSGKNDMSFYVAGGNTVDINVPLGDYYMYYCSGSTWYGVEDKFGSSTSYAKADDVFDFYASGDYVYGHTVTLYTVAGGNLETENISETQFPG